MKPQSLRLRLLMLAAAAVAAALVLSAIGLVALFGRHVERRIGVELDTHILQIAGNLRFDPAGNLFLEAEPSDPRFAKPYGGLYWQVLDETRSARLRSVSLWDADLGLPEDVIALGETHSHRSTGPDGQPTLVHERRIVLADKNADRPVTVSVAINAAELEGLKSGFGSDIMPALLLLGGLLLGGLWWQVNQGLKPVLQVGAGIRAVRSGESARLSPDVPQEIRPLVSEVNELLDGQEKSLARARDRAADLAHGLKTPLTALASDVSRLRAAGQKEIADDIAALGSRMRDIVERELARSRIRNSRGRYAPIKIAAAASAVIKTLQRTPQGEAKRFENAVPADLSVAVDRDDLNDILGNLLENAARAARAVIAVSAVSGPSGAVLVIEDDGPGVADEDLGRLAERGVRLDRAQGSAGLGLSLVADILEAYGSRAVFSRSSLGGLKVSFSLPAGN